MKALQEEGVDTIFGFPGGAVIDIYDELIKTDIKHYLVRHEQGAVHAAADLEPESGRAPRRYPPAARAPTAREAPRQLGIRHEAGS